jgi:hypothetical protein
LSFNNLNSKPYDFFMSFIFNALASHSDIALFIRFILLLFSINVCKYNYICKWTFKYINNVYAFLYTFIRTYKHIHIYVYANICICIYLYVYVYICIFIHTYMYIYVYIFLHVYTYVYINICLYMYSNIHL